MLGFDGRAARAAWTVILVAVILLAVYSIRKVLLVFVFAILFAYLLSPIVDLIDRFLPWPSSRTYSLAVVYVLLIGVLILMGVLIGDRASQEASALATGMPKLMDNIEQKLSAPGPAWLAPAKRYLLTQIRERGQSVNNMVLPLLQKAGEHAAEFVSSAITIVLIPILSFFFLKDGRELREQVLSMAGEHRDMWEDIASDLHRLLGQFIRALVILSIVTLLVYSVVLSLMGLPYSVLLASVAAVLEFIPVVGPLSAAVLIVLVAGFGGGSVVLVLAFLATYRIFQDYVLQPHLMSSGAELHPLLIIFGALAGEEVGGVPGLFLSVPVLASLRILYNQVQRARVRPPVTPLEKPVTGTSF
jgi:predicted PurR-regulated permease PerM